MSWGYHYPVGALHLLVCMGLAGCAEAETIELVAIRGCGLDQAFSGLRVQVVGDLTPSAGTELLLGPGEHGSIPALPEQATGIVARGLFGTTVTAVGRSFGVDPELARGRVAGVDAQALVLPVFFAAPDVACAVDDAPSPRVAAGAAGPAGDVLLVGGSDADDALLDALVHVDLFGGTTRELDARLVAPQRGHSVHALAQGRRFAIIGGARAGEIVDRFALVDVAGAGSVRDSGVLTQQGSAVPLADHAHARSPVDGRVLIAGGCDAVGADARCDPAAIHDHSAWLDLDALVDGQDGLVPLPSLQVARAGAHALVGADGVAWVGGGVGIDGLGVASVERLRPGADSWSLVHTLPGDTPIAGLTVLDGGLVLMSDADGVIHWWSEAGSGELDDSARAPTLSPVSTMRPLTVLPGERVLVDGWLFAPGSAAVDPGPERVSLLAASRSGATSVVLADGTVMMMGGWETASGTLAAPSLLRVRPALDGPDEWIPDLAGPQTDAFVCNAPDRATVIVGGLRLDGIGGDADALPPVRAHVRGFRSRSFRLEFEHEVDAGARMHVVLEQGISLVGIELGSDGVLVRRRRASGGESVIDCGASGGGASWAVEVDGAALRIEGSQGVASCEIEWASSAGVAVGFGVSGSGGGRVFGVRLARR